MARVRTIARCCAESAGMDRQEVEDIALVVTEACVNAMRHGSSNGLSDNVIVSLQSLGRTFSAEVSDFGGPSTVPGSPGGPEPGLGLRLMNTICDEVAYAENANGLTLKLTKHARIPTESAAY